MSVALMRLNMFPEITKAAVMGQPCPDPDKNENGVSKLEKDENAVKSIPKAKVSAKEKRHKCSKCSVSFTIKYSLKCHMKEQHPFSSPDTSEMDGNSICHDCGFKCRRITDLRKHLTRSHNVIFRTESLIMQNMSGVSKITHKIYFST